MEDYKKKYEEALERAKEQSSKYGIDKVVLEEVFPELKESEDEKMRKMIIHVINITPATIAVQYRKEMLDWLEKQGKQKSNNKVEQEEDAELTDFESALFSAFSDTWQEYLSGKEVNVAKWAREHSAELLEVVREQKPAWSEEDEVEFFSIIYFLNNPHTSKLCPTLRSNAIDWLKSLKERIKL